MGFILTVIAIALFFYIFRRVLGTIFILLKIFLKAIVYCSPISFTLGAAMFNPWWLMLCIPLSVGYYFLVSKITKKLKEKRYVAG